MLGIYVFPLNPREAFRTWPEPQTVNTHPYYPICLNAAPVRIVCPGKKTELPAKMGAPYITYLVKEDLSYLGKHASLEAGKSYEVSLGEFPLERAPLCHWCLTNMKHII